MTAAWRDLALARALRYLEKWGIAPSAEMRQDLERTVEELAADGDRARLLEEVVDRVARQWGHRRDRVPPATPPIHRSSMGHG